MPSDRPRYVDNCNDCWPRRVHVPPVMVTPAESGHGVTADYLCPAGHTWRTGWNYGDEAQEAA